MLVTCILKNSERFQSREGFAESNYSFVHCWSNPTTEFST